MCVCVCVRVCVCVCAYEYEMVSRCVRWLLAARQAGREDLKLEGRAVCSAAVWSFYKISCFFTFTSMNNNYIIKERQMRLYCLLHAITLCMYVNIRRHQHTRVHAHTGPRRHARAPAGHRHHIVPHPPPSPWSVFLVISRFRSGEIR